MTGRVSHVTWAQAQARLAEAEKLLAHFRQHRPEWALARVVDVLVEAEAQGCEIIEANPSEYEGEAATDVGLDVMLDQHEFGTGSCVNCEL